MFVMTLLGAMLFDNLSIIFSNYGLLIVIAIILTTFVFCGMLSSKPWIANLSLVTTALLSILEVFLFFLGGFVVGMLGLGVGLVAFMNSCYLLDKVNTIKELR